MTQQPIRTFAESHSETEFYLHPISELRRGVKCRVICVCAWVHSRSCQEKNFAVYIIEDFNPFSLGDWKTFIPGFRRLEVSKINLFLHEFMANIYKRDYIREIQITVMGAMSVKRKRVESKQWIWADINGKVIPVQVGHKQCWHTLMPNLWPRLIGKYYVNYVCKIVKLRLNGLFTFFASHLWVKLKPKWVHTVIIQFDFAMTTMLTFMFNHSPPQRLGTLDRVSGQRARRKAPCRIERSLLIGRGETIKRLCRGEWCLMVQSYLTALSKRDGILGNHGKLFTMEPFTKVTLQWFKLLQGKHLTSAQQGE